MGEVEESFTEKGTSHQNPGGDKEAGHVDALGTSIPAEETAEAKALRQDPAYRV